MTEFGKCLTTSLLLLFLSVGTLWGQSEATSKGRTPLVDNLEAEIQLARHWKGISPGIFAKANHLWWQKKGLQVHSGLALAFFGISERYDAPPIQIQGNSFDNHLQFYSGIRQSFFRKKWLYAGLEAYAGVVHYRTKGTYANSSVGFEQDYSVNRLAADYGSRLLLGVQVNPKWGLQLSINNSWRQAAFGLGLAVGLLAGEVDGKNSFGLGVRIQL